MRGAGALRERLTFQARGSSSDDGYGNVEADWADQFTVWARMQPLKGSEPVIAQRLAGVQPMAIQVRSSADTRQVTAGWRAVHDRTATIYNIRSVANFDERDRYLDLIADAGVPT